jgi:hypothetical protein
VVVHDFYIPNTIISPPEADTPLVVDSDAVLVLSRAFEEFKSVARGYPETVDIRSGMQLKQFPSCHSFDVSESRHDSTVKQIFCVSAGE